MDLFRRWRRGQQPLGQETAPAATSQVALVAAAASIHAAIARASVGIAAQTVGCAGFKRVGGVRSRAVGRRREGVGQSDAIPQNDRRLHFIPPMIRTRIGREQTERPTVSICPPRGENLATRHHSVFNGSSVKALLNVSCYHLYVGVILRQRW